MALRRTKTARKSRVHLDIAVDIGYIHLLLPAIGGFAHLDRKWPLPSGRSVIVHCEGDRAGSKNPSGPPGPSQLGLVRAPPAPAPQERAKPPSSRHPLADQRLRSMNVTDGDGQRIGCVRRLRTWSIQQPRHHELYLLFLGQPVAHHAGFDLQRRVFSYRNPLPRRANRATPRTCPSFRADLALTE